MATAQMIRQGTKISTQVQQFLEIFPNAQKSRKDSLTFIKKLLAVTVSNIAHYYKIFPEENFTERMLDGMKIKVLYGTRGKEAEVNQVIRWLKGANAALDKRYLRRLVIGLSSAENLPGEVIDSFTFNFKYDPNGDISVEQTVTGTGSSEPQVMDVSKIPLEHIVKSTISLLASNQLFVENRSETLNTKISLGIKLYYTDSTPDDYEPPYFRPADAKEFKFSNKPLKVALGNVNTPWHTLGLVLSSSEQQLFQVYNDEPADEQQQESEQPPVEQEEEIPEHETEDKEEEIQIIHDKSQESYRSFWSISQPGGNNMYMMDADIPFVSPAKPASGVSTTGSKAPLPHEGLIRCPCKCDELPGVLMCCDQCGLWQHALCFGILEEKSLQHHTCEMCSMRFGEKCTDPLMIALSAEKTQSMSLLRNGIDVCTRHSRIDVDLLRDQLSLNKATGEKLMAQLVEEGIVNARRGKLCTRNVESKKLEESKNQYFFQDSLSVAEQAMRNLRTRDLNKSPLLSIQERAATKNTKTAPASKRRLRSNLGAMNQADSAPANNKRMKVSDAQQES